MKLATFVHGGEIRIGRLDQEGQQVWPLATVGDAARGLLPLIEALADGQPAPGPAGAPLPLADVSLRAPLPLPRRNLWCVGRNYHAHAKELDASVFKDSRANAESWPIVFTKVPECVIGPYDDVRLPTSVSAQIDYEAEVAVIIGKGGRNIGHAQAMDHVFGYTLVNDVTARDVQMRHQQWDMGKSFDTFCPMGPWIVTSDALDPSRMHIRCWVNGELRQDATTEHLIFDIPTLIETVSCGITLYPGDIIATGTPAGVGMGFKPPRFLSDGDVVRVEVDGLGHIENRFVA